MSKEEKSNTEMIEEDNDVPELPEMEEDDFEQERRELEQVRENVTQLHDMADQVKTAGQNFSQDLQEIAQEIEDEELQQEYLFVAESARLAYRRIEFGDNTIVRGGL